MAECKTNGMSFKQYLIKNCSRCGKQSALNPANTGELSGACCPGGMFWKVAGEQKIPLTAVGERR